jgi:vancomycin permeability regulator SanA
MIKRIILCVAIAVLAIPGVARLVSALWAQGRVYEVPGDVAHHHVAVIFGAGIRNGLPTPMLYDRVASAVDLYRAGVVEKLLMSGDNRFIDYNEPEVMRQTALKLGVPDKDIVLDYAGRSTYETCYRVGAIFGLSDAVLVTQRFHLDRALMTCNQLGVRAVGYAADRRPYGGSVWWSTLREIPATVNALVDLYVAKPLPVLGDRIVID